MADAERTMPLFQPVPYHTPQNGRASLSYESFDAGHILGSSSIVLQRYSRGRPRCGWASRATSAARTCRSSAIRKRMPPADYLIMESTYGGRLHKDVEHVVNKLADVVNRTAQRGGRIIVPAFAVGRTQQLVLLLHQLANEKRIPNIPIFVDSPLAINVTEVHRDHPECFDDETREYLSNGEDPFGFKRLQYIREAGESKKLNDLHGPFVVISASGMAEQGRILHHLRNNIEDPRNTVLITGFQAAEHAGPQAGGEVAGSADFRRADARARRNRQPGRAERPRRPERTAGVAEAPGSAPAQVFLVHGEPAQQEVFAGLIRSRITAWTWWCPRPASRLS